MDLDTIKQVNRDINRIEYKSDKEEQGVEDAWLTPKEMLSNGGDCEDYAIAKYFKLQENGANIEDMRITSVTLNDGRAHMVLTYKDGDNTYVLDNINKKVMPIEEREEEFTQIYSFNEDSLYVGEKRVGATDRIEKWSDLLSQMEEDSIIDDYEDGGV